MRFRVEVRHTKLRAPRKRRRRKREEEVWMSKGSEEAVSVLSDATKCPHLIFSLLNKSNVPALCLFAGRGINRELSTPRC